MTIVPRDGVAGKAPLVNRTDYLVLMEVAQVEGGDQYMTNGCNQVRLL